MKQFRHALLLSTALLGHHLSAGLLFSDGAVYTPSFTYSEADAITFSAVPAGNPTSVLAGFYKLDFGGDPAGQVVTFCIELSEHISGTNAMTYLEKDSILSTPLVGLTGEQASALDRLLGQFYVGTAVSDWVDTYGSLTAAGNRATALQLAVWEITHETQANGCNLASGDFAVAWDPTSKKGLVDYPTELAPINDLLATISQDLSSGNLTSDHLRGLRGLFDFGQGVQDQIFYAVPEPAFIGLQALLLGGVLLGRRRHHQRRA